MAVVESDGNLPSSSLVLSTYLPLMADRLINRPREEGVIFAPANLSGLTTLPYSHNLGDEEKRIVLEPLQLMQWI
ncbi:hypothetical protein JTE90_015503 [Oedothorax gibbosus]|uniref:Uncharacterized protein n=1 Tax=Oedothorax gibbosus TaxID=931172 RepID=A0AAV6VPW7_9ARAC|nr:hypothetical protein JTE90_015503 [Oedothorax gibbosus]